MTPQRVLILHDYAGARGGAEMLALDLRRELRSRGVDARLMTTTADLDPSDDAATSDYLCAGTTGRLRALPETYNPSARMRLAQVLREFRPDIVHLMMFMTALSPSILPLLMEVPVVHSCNTYREVCPTGLRWRPDAGLCTVEAGSVCSDLGCFGPVAILPRLLQLGLKRRWQHVIDRSIAPSEATASIMRSHGWPVTDVFPYAVPETAATAEMAVAPTIAFAGRLTREKGVDWLIDAVAHAGERLGEARIDILGHGPERPALEARVQGLGLAGRVVFHGNVKRDLAQAMLSRAWVQVVPSLWPEPFGLVVAESLMRGTPAIVTDQGAPPGIVRHGRTGWTVPVRDVPALADTLVEALRSRSRLREMGAVAAADARERFGVGRYMNRILGIYGELLAREPRPSYRPLAASHGGTNVVEGGPLGRH